MLSGSHMVTHHSQPTPPRRPRQFTDQFRRAIGTEGRNGTPLAQVARCHDLSIKLVRRWGRKLSGQRVAGHHEPYTTEFVRTVLADVHSGMTQKAACAKHGVSRSCVHRWVTNAKRQSRVLPTNDQDSISTSVLTGEPELSLEHQLRNLLTQYRTLHARIEHIRQLVAVA